MRSKTCIICSTPFSTRKIIQVPIHSLMTIIRNAPKSFELETPSHVASARWLPFARCCMLTKVHFSCAVDEIISVSHRAGSEREMRSQCKHLSGTPKRANTGAECPEVANSLAYTRVPSIRTIRCSVLFPCSASSPGDRFHPQRFRSSRFRPQKRSRIAVSRGLTWRKKKLRLLWYANRGNFSRRRICFGDFSSRSAEDLDRLNIMDSWYTCYKVELSSSFFCIWNILRDVNVRLFDRVFVIFKIRKKSFYYILLFLKTRLKPVSVTLALTRGL